jgi:hypothetical protein
VTRCYAAYIKSEFSLNARNRDVWEDKEETVNGYLLFAVNVFPIHPSTVCPGINAWETGKSPTSV